MTPSGRESGRRRYDEADLRRIAVIQLCQNTALMSLDEIRVVLAGGDQTQGWREAVQGRLQACDEQLARLSSARAYLAHVLECPSEDPVQQCPYLAKEIDEHLTQAPSRQARRAVR
ncbi:hypothetical protein Prum_074310 [Phytohabitans rumicis]|uniref:HTH merR-type domain-containing protein n=1 Tax=Phytohabitans rumicis TaxID=1076125 RepID=A0A6V8LGT3_9ACTN|nr:hypothetical protein Prum_074310 [Phytohabitans rumicis]